MLVRDAKGKYEVIDYRETAPAAAHRDMYQGRENASTIGGLAVGVPGELRGLEYLHQRFGVSVSFWFFGSHLPFSFLVTSSCLRSAITMCLGSTASVVLCSAFCVSMLPTLGDMCDMRVPKVRLCCLGGLG